MSKQERLVIEVCRYADNPNTFYARTSGSDMPRMEGEGETIADAMLDMLDNGVEIPRYGGVLWACCVSEIGPPCGHADATFYCGACGETRPATMFAGWAFQQPGDDNDVSEYRYCKECEEA